MEICKISVGGKEFRIQKVKDIDSLFSKFIASEGGRANEEHIPYWADLWPSAIGLSEFMSENPSLLKNRIIHEIGCGLGLPGIVAGSLGAKKVLFSDLLQEPLELVRSNWNLNLNGAAEVLQLDFSKQNIPEGADLILASDIAYERRLFPILQKLFVGINQTADILFSEPSRELAKDLIPLLERSGLKPIAEKKEIVHKGLKINVIVYFIPRNS